MIGLTAHKIDYQVSVHDRGKIMSAGHLVPNNSLSLNVKIRGGKAVGVYFCLHGPRSVK